MGAIAVRPPVVAEGGTCLRDAAKNREDLALTLSINYLAPEHYDAVLQDFIAQGTSRTRAVKAIRDDSIRIAEAIRDAHFTQPWNQLPDFMDPVHHIDLMLMPGPNGALVTLWLDGENKGLFSIGEKFEVRFLGVPTDDKPIEVKPTADVLPFKGIVR
jgi:hypothetical protein